MTENTEQIVETMVYGYARVSTKDQKLESQEESILRYCRARNWKIAKMFTDKMSGKNIERKGFQDMMQELEFNPYGVSGIVIVKLDRMGRNLKDLLEIVEKLKTQNISLVSINDSIDTTTPMGRLAFHILGALAEYERSLILERTAAGREYAMEHKTAKFGRKNVHVNMKLVKELLNRGVPLRRVARDLRISPGTLYNRLEAEKTKSIAEIESDTVNQQ